MQGAIPRLAAVLVELVERLVVHEDDGDGVGDAMTAEAKEIVVAGIYPRFTRERGPEQEAAKNGQGRAHGGPDQSFLLDRYALHPFERVSLGRAKAEDSFFQADVRLSEGCPEMQG